MNNIVESYKLFQVDKETIITWNNKDYTADVTAKDLYIHITSGKYPTSMMTLKDFKFLDNKEEELDWVLFSVYKELFSRITILMHKKYLIEKKKINIINILNQAIINKKLDELIKFVYDETSQYKKIINYTRI